MPKQDSKETSKTSTAKTVYRDSASGSFISKNKFPENRVLKQGEVPKK